MDIWCFLKAPKLCTAGHAAKETTQPISFNYPVSGIRDNADYTALSVRTDTQDLSVWCSRLLLPRQWMCYVGKSFSCSMNS